MSQFNPPSFRLYRGDVLLGTIKVTGGDFPWFEGEFDAAPGFETARPLFEEELRLMDTDDVEDRWSSLWEEITAPGLCLEREGGGTPETQVLIHIDGRKTWCRT